MGEGLSDHSGRVCQALSLNAIGDGFVLTLGLRLY